MNETTSAVALAKKDVGSEQAISLRESAYMPAMSMEIALARREAIVQFTKRIMCQDQDFGVIPGTQKPTLLKPGAEKLCNFFGLEPDYIPVEEIADWTGEGHNGEMFYYIRYRCVLRRDGRVLGVGEGSCNSWESKYRYRWLAEDQLPACVEKSKLQSRGGRRTLVEFEFAVEKAETTGQYGKPAEYWRQFQDAITAGKARHIEKDTKKGKRPAWEIDVDTTLYRMPNPDIADQVNTIQKMGQKRALVASTLIATSASEFFTQDLEDLHDQSGNGSHADPARETHEQLVERRIAEEREKAQRPADPAPAPAASRSPYSDMLALFGKAKAALGREAYYRILGNAGYTHANEIPDVATGSKILDEMAAEVKPPAPPSPLPTRSDFNKLRMIFLERGAAAVEVYDRIIVENGGTPGGFPKMASGARKAIAALQKALAEMDEHPADAEKGPFVATDADLPAEMFAGQEQ